MAHELLRNDERTRAHEEIKTVVRKDYYNQQSARVPEEDQILALDADSIESATLSTLHFHSKAFVCTASRLHQVPDQPAHSAVHEILSTIRDDKMVPREKK